jgi:predicted secreted protein
MQVTLFSEAQHQDPAQLSQQVSARLNAAIARAREVPGVKVSSGNRHSYAIQDEDGRRITGWRERGEIRLESQDFAALSKLTGELLDSLGMAGMSFGIAPKTRSSHEDALVQQAVAAFQARAELATAALGGKGYRLVSLNLDGGGFQPMMARQREVMSSMLMKDAAPEVEAGSSQVNLSAQGVIEVQMP